MQLLIGSAQNFEGRFDLSMEKKHFTKAIEWKLKARCEIRNLIDVEKSFKIKTREIKTDFLGRIKNDQDTA